MASPDLHNYSSSTCRKVWWLAITLCLASAMSSQAMAELYKYKNEDGITVLDSHVPARYVKNGYSILSLDGRVLEVVARALTDEEIRIRDRDLAEKERKEREKREQDIADQNLLRLYSTPADVIRARDTKLNSINGYISTQKGNLQRLETQVRQLQSELADIERSGGVISNDRLARIRNIEGRMQQIEADVQGKRVEIDDLRASYAADLKRVKELWDRPSSRR
jgi:hypothetical protein